MPAWNLHIDKSGERMRKWHIKQRCFRRERLVLLENENKARERGLRGPVAGSGFRFPSQRRAPPPGGEPGASARTTVGGAFQGMLVWLPASFKPFFHLVECSSTLTRLPALPLLCHSRLQSCSNPFLNEILSLKLSSASHAIMSKSQSAHSGREALCSPVPFFPL